MDMQLTYSEEKFMYTAQLGYSLLQNNQNIVG